MAKAKIKHKIGNGEDTFLWFDNWHPKCPLFRKYGTYVVGIPLDAKVSIIIRNSKWKWAITNTRESIEIREDILQLLIRDSLSWNASPTGKFHMGRTWKFFML